MRPLSVAILTIFPFNAAQGEFTARKIILNLPARGTKNGMTVHLAAKTSGRRQSPITPVVESATTAALYNTLRIQPRQIHIPFNMALLVQGVVFFRR